MSTPSLTSRGVSDQARGLTRRAEAPRALRESVWDDAAYVAIAGDVDLAVLQPIRDAVTRHLVDATGLTIYLPGIMTTA